MICTDCMPKFIVSVAMIFMGLVADSRLESGCVLVSMDLLLFTSLDHFNYA